ncbi:MAG: hypothetical protein KC618_03590, partial [Candidatus Omnitrophica bacterium]|nr:hypothetical protein [Candidatus Omnitrophota bacterium]
MIKFATTVKKRIRRFTRDIVRRAPKEWRYPLYRNHVNLSYELPKNLTLKLAETQQELEKAYSLVHDSYIEMGYMDPHNSGMRLGFYNMLPYTSTVIASWDGEVIGTFSVVLNNPARLPIESDFDITYLNRRYSRVAEIIGLTVKKDFRSSHGNILFPLLKYLY